MTSENISLALSQDKVRVQKDAPPAELFLTVENCSENIKDYAVSIDVPELKNQQLDWIRLEPSRIVGLYPRSYREQKSTEDVSILIASPDYVPAGEYTLNITVASERDSAEVGEATCKLLIGPSYDFEMEIEPKQGQLLQAVFDIQLTNKGNAPVTVHLSIDDPVPQYRFTFDKPGLSLDVDEQRDVTLIVDAKTIPSQKEGRKINHVVAASLAEDPAVVRQVSASWRQTYPDLDLTISPQSDIISEGEIGFTVLLRNHSREDLELTLEAVDPQQLAEYAFESNEIALPAGSRYKGPLKSTSLPGEPGSLSVEVFARLATTGDVVAKSQASVKYEPTIPIKMGPPVPLEPAPPAAKDRTRRGRCLLLIVTGLLLIIMALSVSSIADEINSKGNLDYLAIAIFLVCLVILWRVFKRF